MNDVPTTPAPVPISILPTAGGNNPVPAQTDWVPVAIWVPNKFGPGAGGFTTYKIQIQYVGGQGAPGPPGPQGPPGPPGSAGSPGGSANQIQVNVGGTSFGGITNGSAGQVLTAQTAGPPMFVNAPGGNPGGASGQVQFNSTGTFGGFTVGGDGTLNTSTGNLTVTKTNGTNFAASATTDTTNASNISSGNLSVNRLNGGSGASSTTFWCGDNTWKVPAGGGGASVTISDTPPASPSPGNMWWESDTGLFWIYYNDGNSTQWVAVNGLTPTSMTGVLSVRWFDMTNTPSGIGSYVPTPGMQTAVIECVGGGGGGSGINAAGSTTTATNSGGGSGGYSRKFVTATQVGASQVVTIGAAGAGGPAGSNPGGAGGDTSVGTLCIAKGARAPANYAIAGLGGLPGTGDIAAGGAPGDGANFFVSAQGGSFAGNGGSSVFGGGGATGQYNVSGNGANATSYGSGGAGATSFNNAATNYAGGNGSPGIVIITEYAAVAASATTQQAIPGALSGLTLTWNSATSLSVAPGGATSDDNALSMLLASTLQKNLTNWTAGNAGGLFSSDSPLAASTWFHVFLIENVSSGAVDVLASKNLTTGAGLVLPSGYSKQRRIGSILTDASSNMISFSQYGDDFLWTTSIQNYNSAALATGNLQLLPLSCPAGVKTIVHFTCHYQPTTASLITFHSPDQSGVGANIPAGNTSIYIANVSTVPALAQTFRVRTNTNSQIYVSCNAGTASGFYAVTHGWTDNRGK